MAPSRKSRSVNKRFSYPNEISPTKDGDSGNRSSKRKRKVSDMLGPQWSKEELQRFYEAYRKFGKDWKKVATAVRNRSVEMVEALYTMNRAYLSLPEGTASVVGLIAMMTDHYSVLEGSDSEQESNDGTEMSRKPKRARGKPQPNLSRGSEKHFADASFSQSVASSYGCLSLLKRRRSMENQPRAVGKRTPRIPVRYTQDKDSRERHIFPSVQGLKLRRDADDVAHAALVLTEASHRGGSPQASQTPNRRREFVGGSPGLGERMLSESEMTSAKTAGHETEDDACEGSLGSTEGDNNFPKEGLHLVSRRGFGASVQLKSRKSNGMKLEAEDVGHYYVDDIREACSGTEEGQKFSSFERKLGADIADVSNVRSPGQASKKRSKKLLFGGDEGEALDALHALADLSLMMPATAEETESTFPFKDEKEKEAVKSRTRENLPTNQHRVKTKPSPSKKKGNEAGLTTRLSESRVSKPGRTSALDSSPVAEIKDGGIQKRRSKSSVSKVLASDIQMDSEINTQKKELPDHGRKLVNKSRRSSQNVSQQQLGQLLRISEHSCSSTDIKKEGDDSAVSSIQAPASNKIKSMAKSRNRRKLDKSGIQRNVKDMRISEALVYDPSSTSGQSLHDKMDVVKEQLSNCLSNYRVRRWCMCEWFYSAIDYPWFAKSEFVEYLYHVGLGHVPRLTRVEWDVIRSSLGKPRRFSEQFLKEEKEKLNYYRKSVRNHYTELRMGKREGLPTDLARPLTVGQRVIAVHPRSREVHNGGVLTVDHDRCRIQFDRPELGVEFVKDIDCMPLDPMENMPASFKRHHITIDKFYEALKQFKVSKRPEERTKEEVIKFTPSQKMEDTDGLTDVGPAFLMNSLSNPAKEGFVSSSTHVKIGHNEIVSSQQAITSQQSVLSQMQSKEADIHAVTEVTRALDKKIALVNELRCMNDDVSEDSSLKDADSFKKQYAAVVVQLNEVSDQVSSALICLRQRNTYQVNSVLPWLKPLVSMEERSGLTTTFQLPNDSQETDSHVYEIVENSRVKARKMVDAAIQAVSSLREGENTVQSIEEAVDYVSSRLSIDGTNLSLQTGQANNGFFTRQNQATTGASKRLVSDQKLDSRNGACVESDTQIPSELITNCLATLLMIQKCTERQFPPADVAQILDFAVTSLQPCSSRNLPVYAEIQKCMGIIRSQILALVPT